MQANQTCHLHFCPGLSPQVSSFIQKQDLLKIIRYNLDRNKFFVETNGLAIHLELKNARLPVIILTKTTTLIYITSKQPKAPCFMNSKALGCICRNTRHDPVYSSVFLLLLSPTRGRKKFCDPCTLQRLLMLKQDHTKRSLLASHSSYCFFLSTLLCSIPSSHVSSASYLKP